MSWKHASRVSEDAKLDGTSWRGFWVVGTKRVRSHPYHLLGGAPEVNCSQGLAQDLPWRKVETGFRNELTFKRSGQQGPKPSAGSPARWSGSANTRPDVKQTSSPWVCFSPCSSGSRHRGVVRNCAASHHSRVPV